MRRSFAVAIAVLASAFLFTSCTMVRYYKSSDIKKTFRGAEQKVQKLVREAKKNVKVRRSKLKELAAHKGTTLKQAPFKGLNQTLKEMSGEIKKLKVLATKISKLNKKASKTLGKRKKVATNDPAFDKIEALKKQLEELHGQSTAVLSRCKELDAGFVERAQKIK